MSRASRAQRANRARSRRSSPDSDASSGGLQSRDARAFGSMDLHDTQSDRSSQPSNCGDGDDPVGTSPRGNVQHVNEVSLTSLSNLGPEHARRSPRFRGRAGGGASTVSENDATRILERIFSMSSRPSQSPPVLDVSDSTADSKACSPGQEAPGTPSYGGHRTPAHRPAAPSLWGPHIPPAHRHSCPQIGTPAHRSLSPMSLMPPPLSQVHQHSGPNFLRPPVLSPCLTNPEKPRPPSSAYRPLPLHSRASSRCRAPTRGSDADVSSSLDSSPERSPSRQTQAHTPFPLQAATTSLVAPPSAKSAAISSSTSLSTISDADASITTKSTELPNHSATISNITSVDSIHGPESRPAAAAAAAASATARQRAPTQAAACAQSCSDTTSTRVCSPADDVSRGIAPVELFRPPCRAGTSVAAPGDRSDTPAVPPAVAHHTEVVQPREVGRRLVFRERFAVGCMTLLPDLAIVSTVLLAASGVMLLAYSSAMVHTLTRQQRTSFPRDAALVGLLLVRALSDVLRCSALAMLPAQSNPLHTALLPHAFVLDAAPLCRTFAMTRRQSAGCRAVLPVLKHPAVVAGCRGRRRCGAPLVGSTAGLAGACHLPAAALCSTAGLLLSTSSDTPRCEAYQTCSTRVTSLLYSLSLLHSCSHDLRLRCRSGRAGGGVSGAGGRSRPCHAPGPCVAACGPPHHHCAVACPCLQHSVPVGGGACGTHNRCYHRSTGRPGLRH